MRSWGTRSLYRIACRGTNDYLHDGGQVDAGVVDVWLAQSSHDDAAGGDPFNFGNTRVCPTFQSCGTIICHGIAQDRSSH